MKRMNRLVATIVLSAATAIGAAAPREITLETLGLDSILESPTRSATDERVLVLDFWATWCLPCVAQLEEVSDLQARYAASGVRFVGITDEPADTIAEFLQREHAGTGRTQRDRMRFDVAIDTDRSSHEAVLPASIRQARPMFAVIGPTGTVEWVGLKDNLEGVLEQVLAGTWTRDEDLGEKNFWPEVDEAELFAGEDWKAIALNFYNDHAVLSRAAFLIAFDYDGVLKNRDFNQGEWFATRAIEITKGAEPYPLHSLAKLRAEAGDVDSAIALQRDVVRIAEQDEDSPYIEYYRSQLVAYEELAETSANTMLIEGGMVFDGKTFVQRDLYITGDRFVKNRPPEISVTVDASGKFIVPPYGDAHTHNLDREWQLGSLPDQYLAEGTFYVQNLTSKTRNIERFRTHFATAETPDVVYSHQGLTSTLGHPFMAYEPFAMGLNDGREWGSRLAEIVASRIDEGNSYIFLDSIEDAEAKLPAFFDAGPDVVKIFITTVEEYPENSSDEIPGNSGLAPDVAEFVVKAAHAEGKRVFAHIDTAEDFELAVRLGVDGLAHMPTWRGTPETREQHEVDPELFRRAAERGLVMTPTLTITALGVEGADAEARDAFNRDFLRRFVDAGGGVIAGSDMFGRTLRIEIETWITKGIFTPLELLRIISIDTPRAIFPDRQIGSLDSGSEGSLLALNSNPLVDPESLFDIHCRIKQGVVLGSEETESER